VVEALLAARRAGKIRVPAERGALDETLRSRVRAAFVGRDEGWIGQV
jgi:hypothetical protein